MKHIFILNPTAGKGKIQQVVKEKIVGFFGEKENYEIHITENPGHAGIIARQKADTGEHIRFYACGGEGTCFEVLNGIAGKDNVELATIPCGSANDFLKFFGDKDVFLDIEQMVDGDAVPIDLIKANEFYCINQCSVGMDAIVAKEMQGFKRWPLVSGSMAYKLAIIKVFVQKIGLDLKITVDNKFKGVKNCLFAVCANGPVYGGGYTSAPSASPLDNKLNYVIVETISKLKILSFLKRYEQGTHTSLYCCECGENSTMTIEADKEFPLNLDGEIIMRKKVDFNIVKSAIKFVVPKAISNNLQQKGKFTQKDLTLV